MILLGTLIVALTLSNIEAKGKLVIFHFKLKYGVTFSNVCSFFFFIIVYDSGSVSLI